MPLCIITITTFEALLSFLLYVLTPVSDRQEWSSNLVTEAALDSENKLDSWLLCTRKVRLLKIIKTYSVINITRAYTEIFPKAATKKRNYLPTKDRYSSVRCVILKDKARCIKFFRKLYWKFFCLDKDSKIYVITTSYCSKTPLTICSSFKTVYRAVNR